MSVGQLEFYLILAMIVISNVVAAWSIGRGLRRLQFRIDCIGGQILPCKVCRKVGNDHTQQEAESCSRAHKRRMALERKAAKAR